MIVKSVEARTSSHKRFPELRLAPSNPNGLFVVTIGSNQSHQRYIGRLVTIRDIPPIDLEAIAAGDAVTLKNWVYPHPDQQESPGGFALSPFAYGLLGERWEQEPPTVTFKWYFQELAPALPGITMTAIAGN